MQVEDPFEKYARLRNALAAMDDADIKSLRNHKIGTEESARVPLPVNFQLEDLSDSFFLELQQIHCLEGKFRFLRNHKDLKIKIRVGNNGSFGDQVALNVAMREGRACFKSFSVSPRRGYVLAKFIVDLAVRGSR